MKVKQFAFNHFQTTCYVLWDEASKECVIVDPCAEASYEDERLAQFIEGNGLKVVKILLTHAHIDHIAGLREVCEKYHIPVTLHADGVKLLKQAEAYGTVMGFNVRAMDDLPCEFIEDNTMLEIGAGSATKGCQIECRYVPGHCPGSMAYVLHDEQMVITGDALFRGSIGRTDLPGGSYPLLIEKIQNRIMTLPDDYQVLPGHGDLSTIGEERLYNGFLS
ncbi:MAG: MBL fold metallo-hydrolase [Bacteroidales bacterium]|nr:MBL fold metallo-hydrolase [Bacteroidales bacterium]